MLIDINMAALTEAERHYIYKLLNRCRTTDYPQLGTQYFYLDEFGDIAETHWQDSDQDKWHFNGGNYYADRATAEWEGKHRVLLTQLQQYADKMNSGWLPDWEDTKQDKYSLVVNSASNGDKVYAALVTSRRGDSVYFKTADAALLAIKQFGESELATFLYR